MWNEIVASTGNKGPDEGREEGGFSRLSHRVWGKSFVNTCPVGCSRRLSCVGETVGLLWESWFSCRMLPVLDWAVKTEQRNLIRMKHHTDAFL